MPLSPYQQKRLQDYAELRDPALKMNRVMAEALMKVEVMKGEKGDMGDAGPQGERGPQGDRGADGYNGIDGIDGKDGKNGVNGVDGRHGKDGKNGKDGVSPDFDSIVEEVRRVQVTYKDIKDAPDLTDLPKLIEFLKMGGFRGGGGSSTGTVAIVYTETPSGLINSSNKIYTVLHSITNVYSFAINGQFLHPTTDYTASGATITFVNALDSSLSGTPFTITYS